MHMNYIRTFILHNVLLIVAVLTIVVIVSTVVAHA